MNVKDWDIQVELARTAVETAFQVADEMADRIEVLETALAKAVKGLKDIVWNNGPDPWSDAVAILSEIAELGQ